MPTKSFIYLGLFLGSTIGGAIPLLWGASAFSFSSLIFSCAGAIAGLYIAFKLTR